MWISRHEFQRLLGQAAAAEDRAAKAEAALELERHENRKAERYWANAVLKARGQHPLVDGPVTPPPKPVRAEPTIDPGEREALIAEAQRLGIDNPVAAADTVLRAEHPLF